MLRSAHEAQPAFLAASMLPPSASLADLIQRLAQLEIQVAALQQQLAQPALQRLQERTRASETEPPHEAWWQRPAETWNGPPQADLVAPFPRPVRRLQPVELRVRSRMPPLIEYSAQGHYVIVSALEGEIHVEPDWEEWFEWLATISSFRFIGREGRFFACRTSEGGQRTRGWLARRCAHGQDLRYYLGVTDRFTIAHLEQAALLQARVDAL